MNSIKFFGTSNANPHPDRRQSGILLTINDNHYLFDCGDSIPSALWNDPSVNLNQLHAVFFTHRHPDHIGGLPNLLLLLHQRIKNSKKIQPGASIERVIPPKNKDKPEFAIFIPGSPELGPFFEKMTEYMHIADNETAYMKKFFSFRENTTIYKDQNIEITTFPTFHCPDACGFLIKVGDKTILYSGDIKHPMYIGEILHEQLIDIVIIESAHFPPTAITEILKDFPIKTIIITHRKDEYLANPEKNCVELQELKKNSEVILAEDGLIVNF